MRQNACAVPARCQNGGSPDETERMRRHAARVPASFPSSFSVRSEQNSRRVNIRPYSHKQICTSRDFDDSLTHGIAWTIPNDPLQPPPFRDLVAENDNLFTCFFGPACVSISYAFILRRVIFYNVAKVRSCVWTRILTKRTTRCKDLD